ncbi:DNA (Cytosine-5)-methyltransferase DRM1/2 isoform 4 [Hibiscus syriacus]|uniref:DNA (Cytosine-5)-methyltransferase DRM1/2 isoform 4 n=1 Tax=Hibiscus syriacus TaxID=106335 RepID=A0A6A2YHV0_HIBSY|nr:DNA (Cytosine-5)-methyltransferase DRM1/2 isoform 4 [Hibiscus syriacus]
MKHSHLSLGSSVGGRPVTDRLPFGGGLIGHHKALVGPDNRVVFGESPSYVVTHPNSCDVGSCVAILEASGEARGTIFQDDFTDIDSSSDTEEILNSDSDEENKLLYLTKIGYSEAEASIAMERCGPESSIAELTDFICDAQMAKKQRKLEKKLLNEGGHAVHLSNPMIGFGIPIESDHITQKTLPEDAIRPPYFYYENVTFAPVVFGLKVTTHPILPLSRFKVMGSQLQSVRLLPYHRLKKKALPQ